MATTNFRTLPCGWNLRWPPYVQGQTINWYHFLENSSRFVILVSTIGFSSVPDIVVWAKKNFGHCIVGKIQDRRHFYKVRQWINVIFGSIEADSSFLLSTIRVFGHALHSEVVRKYYVHCIVGIFYKWLPFLRIKNSPKFIFPATKLSLFYRSMWLRNRQKTIHLSWPQGIQSGNWSIFWSDQFENLPLKICPCGIYYIYINRIFILCFQLGFKPE